MDTLTTRREAHAEGFSTIELMIALTIMTMVLAAVVIVSFGEQSFLTGSQTNAEAMNKAQELIEAEQADGRKDFNLVNSIATTTDDVYEKSVTSRLLSDWLTKEVTARVSWTDEKNLLRSVSLTTLVSDFANVSAGTTCDSSPTGDWTAPASTVRTLSGMTGLGGSYPVTAIDAYRGAMYVGAGPTSGAGDKTFFIFDLSGGVPSNIGAGSALDTSGAASTRGTNAIVVVATTTSPGAKTYAYLASGVTPDWNTSCAAASTACAQLQVVDVTNASAPSIVTNFKFATNTPPYITGSSGQANGQAIFYKNGYIFLGLTKTGVSSISGTAGPEFVIIDVHNPLSPALVGSYTIGRTIKSIVVSGNFAYLATDDNASNNILTILDVSDLTSPHRVWPGALATGIGFGRSVTIVGDTLHFTKTADSGTPEWYTLSNPRPSTQAPVVSGAGLNLGSSLSINNIVVRDYLAFLTTSPTGQLLVHNTATFAQVATPISLPAAGVALDCERNYLYAGSSDAAGTITAVTAL